MVQLYVSQLRKLLDGSVGEILTHGRGYELRLAVDRVDAAEFERLVDAAMHPDGEPNGVWRSVWRGLRTASDRGVTRPKCYRRRALTAPPCSGALIA